MAKWVAWECARFLRAMSNCHSSWAKCIFSQHRFFCLTLPEGQRPFSRLLHVVPSYCTYPHFEEKADLSSSIAWLEFWENPSFIALFSELQLLHFKARHLNQDKFSDTFWALSLESSISMRFWRSVSCNSRNPGPMKNDPWLIPCIYSLGKRLGSVGPCNICLSLPL